MEKVVTADERIDEIDADLRSLTLKVGQLESNVGNIARNMGEMNNTLKTLNQKITQSGKTDWGLLASWATVIISIMSMFGYLTMTPVTDEITKLRAWKRSAIEQISDASTQIAVQKERVRALERSEFKEPKDQ